MSRVTQPPVHQQVRSRAHLPSLLGLSALRPWALRPWALLPWALLLWALLLWASVALAACNEDKDALAPARYVLEGIPQPIWDSAVDGGFQYLGEGRFISEFGVEFFWRDGRFVNADGTMMDLPASAREHLESLGIYHQPTIPPTLSPGKTALVEEAERIRRGLIGGTLVFEWYPPSGSDLPADPEAALDAIERSAFAPDVVVYLTDPASSDPRIQDALMRDINALPEVQFTEFASWDKPAVIRLWLIDPIQSDQIVDKLREREEIEEVVATSADFAALTALLRSAIQPR